MAKIYICFLWHMHQPFYKNLVSGEYKLPWTRLHALKDYYGMVKILEAFPEIHQTFNLVPSLMAQIEEYSSGAAVDPFLSAALQPAESLSPAGKSFILQYFFQANPSRMIYRYPRYGELFDRWQATHQNPEHGSRLFNAQDMRDLQVLSQLAWFDEEYHRNDPRVQRLTAKGSGYDLEDQKEMGALQIEAIGKVFPIYRQFAAAGQIEISTTPFYHPILPLLCDTDIAEVSHPYLPLPSRFAYPEDARYQLEASLDYVEKHLGIRPTGLWPSEGSVSDKALELAAQAGFRWFASDNGVLGRTLGTEPSPAVTYKPYTWAQGDNQIQGLFRDHHLSDLIGFVYARMGAEEGAAHLISQIEANCKDILATGRDALVPLILDGENAWEYYEESGRSFLRSLYQRIANDPGMSAVTVSEALAKVDAEKLATIVPGSWINANFNIWIGSEEDNRAWEYLLLARQTYEKVVTSSSSGLTDRQKKLAYEELMIAEGSDWCWWYGPEHESANRADFDRLFRDHLKNVYLALGVAAPSTLDRPILKISVKEFHQASEGPVQATVDGEITSPYEWAGSGLYCVDSRSGAMHGKAFLVHELRYGSDGKNLYFRIDFADGAAAVDEKLEMELTVQSTSHSEQTGTFRVTVEKAGASDSPEGVHCVNGRVLEARAPLSFVGISIGHTVRFQISLRQGGLPAASLPASGWIDLPTVYPSN